MRTKKKEEAKRFLSDEKIKEVAQGLIQNKYFMSDQLPEHMKDQLHLVFMPLVFMKKDALKKMADWDVVCLYEENRLAMPRGINGLPIFPSCSMLTREDYKRVIEVEGKLRKAMNDALASDKGTDGRPPKAETANRRATGSKRRPPRPSAR